MFGATILLLLTSCSSTPVTLAQNCDVRLESLSETTVLEGQAVRGVGGPMTTIWDTAVYVSGTRAEVIELQRSGCDACDDCKEVNDCNACDDCDPCDAVCEAECTESFEFVAPEIAGTSAAVSFYNGHGQSNAISITYGVPADTADPTDTGESVLPVDTASPEDTSLAR